MSDIPPLGRENNIENFVVSIVAMIRWWITASIPARTLKWFGVLIVNLIIFGPPFCKISLLFFEFLIYLSWPLIQYIIVPWFNFWVS
jgi:hypothetical protein